MGSRLGITMAIKFLVVLVWMLPQSLLSIRVRLGVMFSPLVVRRKTLGLGPEWAIRRLEVRMSKQECTF